MGCVAGAGRPRTTGGMARPSRTNRNSQVPQSEVVVYLDPVTRTAHVAGPEPEATAIARNLKRHLADLVEAQDAGDLAALADAAARAQAILDAVTVQFTSGVVPRSSRGGRA